MRKKALQPWESPAATTAPRELAKASDPLVRYPSATELISSDGEWRGWLEEALRNVLRPVALAGAIGMSALGSGGCDAATADASSALTPCESPAATLAPLGAPQLPPPPAPAPVAMPAVVMSPVPATPAPEPAAQPPRVRPPRIIPRPPHIRGRIPSVRTW